MSTFDTVIFSFLFFCICTVAIRANDPLSNLNCCMLLVLANCWWWISRFTMPLTKFWIHSYDGPMFIKRKTTATTTTTTTTTLPKRANHNTCWLGADIVSYLIIMIDWIWMWNTLFRSTVVMMTTTTVVMVMVMVLVLVLAESSAVHSTPSALLRALQSFFFVWYH